MSLFNNVNIPTTCLICHQDIILPIQFKFGRVRQLEYRVGDKLWWGKDDSNIGNHFNNVVVLGFAGWCPACGADAAGGPDDFYIYLSENEISEVVPADGRHHFEDDREYLIVS